jgi:hypothetical protein
MKAMVICFVAIPILLMAGGCTRLYHLVSSSSTGAGTSPAQANDGGTPAVPAGPASFQSTVGTKDFRSLFVSMMMVSGGVSGLSAFGPNAYLHSVAGALSSDGDGSATTGPSLIVTGDLAGNVCDYQINRIQNNPLLNTGMFRKVNFGQGEAQFTDGGQGFILDAVHAAWVRDPTTAEMTALTKAFQATLKAGTPGTTNTSAVALVICAGLLSSWPFYVQM